MFEEFQDHCHSWETPDVDLLASKFNNKLLHGISSTWSTPFLLWTHYSPASQDQDGGHSGRLFMGPLRLSRSSVLSCCPCFMVTGFNSMAVEAQVLRDRGLPNLVIPKFLKARISASHKPYPFIWKAYTHCEWQVILIPGNTLWVESCLFFCLVWINIWSLVWSRVRSQP